MIKPSSASKNPGTGRSRFYEPAVFIDATVLTSLSDAGVTLANIEKFKSGDQTIFHLARLAACQVGDAEKQGYILHLVIFGRIPGSAEWTGTYVFHATSKSSLDQKKHLSEDDLSKPVEMYRTADHVYLQHTAQWSIVLNLNEIFRPLARILTATNVDGFVKVELLDSKEFLGFRRV